MMGDVRTPLMTIALAATLGFIACAVYVAHAFATAPLRDREERVVADEREAA